MTMKIRHKKSKSNSPIKSRIKYPHLTQDEIEDMQSRYPPQTQEELDYIRKRNEEIEDSNEIESYYSEIYDPMDRKKKSSKSKSGRKVVKKTKGCGCK